MASPWDNLPPHNQRCFEQGNESAGSIREFVQNDQYPPKNSKKIWSADFEDQSHLIILLAMSMNENWPIFQCRVRFSSSDRTFRVQSCLGHITVVIITLISWFIPRNRQLSRSSSSQGLTRTLIEVETLEPMTKPCCFSKLCNSFGKGSYFAFSHAISTEIKIYCCCYFRGRVGS